MSNANNGPFRPGTGKKPKSALELQKKLRRESALLNQPDSLLQRKFRDWLRAQYRRTAAAII